MLLFLMGINWLGLVIFLVLTFLIGLLILQIIKKNVSEPDGQFNQSDKRPVLDNNDYLDTGDLGINQLCNTSSREYI